MKKRIVIGIHGIGNKPPQPLLKMWWQKAICEGLDRIGCSHKHFKFELVYWAHFLNSEPLSVSIRDPHHPLYIENPYVPAQKNEAVYTPNRFKKMVLDVIEYLMDVIFFYGTRIFNFDRIGDWVIRKKFRDLELYYHKDNAELNRAGLLAKKMIRETLAKQLRKHRGKEILLIAHSMGTVVAYDVLTQLVPDVEIHTLITLGSPLGLPTIIKQIFREQHQEAGGNHKVMTPENIKHAWLNFSDLDDRIALNYNLSNDFAPNSRGVAPRDVIVKNDYEYHGKRNPHKSYGYLRTPEVAKVIHDFLSEEEGGLLQRLLSVRRKRVGREKVGREKEQKEKE